MRPRRQRRSGLTVYRSSGVPLRVTEDENRCVWRVDDRRLSERFACLVHESDAVCREMLLPAVQLTSRGDRQADVIESCGHFAEQCSVVVVVVVQHEHQVAFGHGVWSGSSSPRSPSCLSFRGSGGWPWFRGGSRRGTFLTRRRRGRSSASHQGRSRSAGSPDLW